MPEPVALLSTASLQEEEFLTFVRTLSIPDARILIHPHEYADVQIVRRSENVWIVLNGADLYYEEGDEDTKIILQKLGAHYQTAISIDIGRDPGSQHLAVAFACAFAKKWPCVVDNLRDEDQKIYSGQEICELREKDLGFWDQK